MQRRRDQRRRRTRRRRVALGIVIAGGVAAAAGGAFAGAADPSLQSRIDSARSDANQLSDTIDARAARLADLQERARQAGAREMVLSAQIERDQARSRELGTELEKARGKLDRVRARYRSALGALTERLVEIYKNPEPDAVSVILQANGVADLQSKAEYLSALHDADARLTDRVRRLRDQVQYRYDRVSGIKAEIDREAARLRSSRAEFAATRAAADRRASQVEAATEAARGELGQVQDRLAQLEQQQQEQEAEQRAAAGIPAYSGGPYSIPIDIVMCESGGNYQAVNPSTGAGGAYQILPSTWAAYGGHGLPQNAPKAEQDRIAAEIWADSGPAAWACG